MRHEHRKQHAEQGHEQADYREPAGEHVGVSFDGTQIALSRLNRL
ncbi:hypothetical protein [Mesorhizobium sp. WSM2239]|uniref:Uncharacterized protein n=2 Tax=unclassified Mesorhizobium TaxID=325217 RepID=A0AAU8DHS1_9HYPH